MHLGLGEVGRKFFEPEGVAVGGRGLRRWAALALALSFGLSTGCDSSSSDGDDLGCVPKSCSELDAKCGSIQDGCGGEISCGSCQAGQECGAQQPNQCAPTKSCMPTTCAEASVKCGIISDGCDGVLDCGKCSCSAVPDPGKTLTDLLEVYRTKTGRGGIEILGAAAAGYAADGTKWAKASGFQDAKKKHPATPDSRWNGSSSAKQFSAILFLKLKSEGVTHQGKPISLDDKLADYGCGNTVPGLANGKCGWGMPARNPAEATNPITIRHLLGNVSGIPIHIRFAASMPSVLQHLFDHKFFGPAGDPGVPNLLGLNPGPPYPPKEITAQYMVNTYDLQWGLDATLETPASAWKAPGISSAGFAYNNLGFTLVALVIEELTGLPYEQALQKHLFDPLAKDLPNLRITQEYLPAGTFSPGYADGYLCYQRDSANKWKLADNGACLDFSDPNCSCHDNQHGWVDKRGFDGAWARGAGYLVSSVSDMSDFLWRLHSGDVLPKGPWSPTPQGEYWELFEWTCDTTKGDNCGSFYRYGMAFYSLAVRNDAGDVLYESYGHDGGGFLPRYNRAAIDFTQPEAKLQAVYVQASNRLTSETDWNLYYRLADASLTVIRECGL